MRWCGTASGCSCLPRPSSYGPDARPHERPTAAALPGLPATFPPVTATDDPTCSPDASDGPGPGAAAAGPRFWTLGLVVCLLVYVVLRIALIPSAADVTRSLSHDGAYIAIVARNLLAGRGLVNDAIWLVFLEPAALPMPFHNANPLYVLATAGVGAVNGGDVVHAGLVVSVLSSALLVLAVTWLVSYFTTRRVALAVAVMAALFPPIYQLSLAMLPDALCLALSVAFLAAFVRIDTRWTWLVAGALFGLAWLTRSSATLLLPAAFVYGVLTWGWRRTVIRGAGVGVATLVVVSPWLWHSYTVWGKPLRSDSSFYLLQDIAALKFGGTGQDALLRYWHGTTPPPTTRGLLRDDPVWLVEWVLLGIPRVLVVLLTEWTSSMRVAAIALAALMAAAISQLRGVWRRPEWIACALLAAAPIGVFAIRSWSVEVRYLALVSLLAAIVLALIVIRALHDVRRGKRGLAMAVAVVGVVFWAVLVPTADVARTRFMRAPRPERVQQQAINRQARDLVGPAPVVVGTSPYYYSYDTRGQALSIPYSDDTYLVRYMNRFGARHILLSDAEMTLWRPEWSPARLPAELRVAGRLTGASLLEMRSPAPVRAGAPPLPAAASRTPVGTPGRQRMRREAVTP